MICFTNVHVNYICVVFRVFYCTYLHYHTQHRLIVSFMYKAVFLPPADVGWSMNDGRISAVGRHRLEYELWRILTVGWEYQLHKPSLSIMWSPALFFCKRCFRRTCRGELTTTWTLRRDDLALPDFRGVASSIFSFSSSSSLLLLLLLLL